MLQQELGKKSLIQTTKVCFRCKVEKDLSEFYRSNTRYFQRECKTCTRERKARWHQTETGKLSSANTKLKRRFGLTLEEYNTRLVAQDSKCQICGVVTNSNGHRLGIDHDHETNELRGLLCKPCNLAISHLQDSPALCERAAMYLRSYGK